MPTKVHRVVVSVNSKVEDKSVCIYKHMSVYVCDEAHGTAS